MDYMGDVHIIRTFDGQELVLPDSENKLIAYGNYGAPPIHHITRRGYKQDGSTKIDYTILERNLSIELWRAPACNRSVYWQNRLALHDLLRPNRGGSLELILTIPDGTQRAIKVDANPGAVFPIDVDDNSWNIDEPIEFIAFDPIWYDPNETVISAASAADAELVFPIDFPIWFGTGGDIFQQSITYLGTWKSYPILTLTGPFTFGIIENLSTGVAIYLTAPVLAGETRIIDLTVGAISITDASGASKFGELGPDSNLVDFNLRPDPEVPGGVQILRAILTDQSVGSSFEISYNERYWAI